MSYTNWNQRLADYFFNEENCNKTVRLAVDGDLLDRDFQELGGSEGFKAALATGPEWLRNCRLSERLESLSLQWNHSRPRPGTYPQFKLKTDQEYREPPPYLPYLAAACYAWTLEGPGLNANDFYSRFKIVIPEPLNDIQQLARFHYLWHELKRWANTRNQGRFGRFSPRPIGGHRHVGIPLAQVILPGRNRRRLGYLFRHVLGIPEDTRLPRELASEDLLDLLRGNDSISRWALGSVALRELNQGDGHVGAILDHVNREIEEWDGEVEDIPSHVASPPSNANPQASPVVRVFSLLQSCRTPNGRKWRALATTMDPSGRFEGSVQLVHAGFKYICTQGGLQVFRREGVPDQVLGVQPFIAGAIQEAGFLDSRDGDGPPVHVRLLARDPPVRFLISRGTDYLEIEAPPEDGPFFVLPTSPKAVEAWADIRGHLGDNVQRLPDIVWIEDIASLPCPDGIWGVPSVSLLEELDDIDWMEKLGIESIPARGFSFAWVKGGTRVRGGGRQIATYLASDPPQVVVNPPPGKMQWEACGADLQELPGNDLQPGDEGGSPEKAWRHFDVLPKPPEPNSLQPTQIILRFRSGDRPFLKQLAFRADWDGQVVPPLQGGGFSVDRLGIPSTEGERVSGCRPSLPGAPANAPIQAGFKARLPRPFSQGATGPKGDSSTLLTFMAARGQGCRRILCSQATKFMMSPVGEDDDGVPAGLVHRDITLLQALGHLELEHDQAGRRNYIHALPAIIYMLPVLHRTGLYQSALSGTYTTGQVSQIQEAAASLGLMLRSLNHLGGGDSGSIRRFLPATLLLLSAKVESYRLLAEMVGIDWVPAPPAHTIADMSASLVDWQHASLDEPFWSADLAPVGDEYFDPEACTWKSCRPTGKGSEGLLLRRGIDSLTRRHRRYQLEKIRDGRPTRLMVVDKQWAIWSVVANHYGIGPILIPFFPSIGGLELPLELDLPPLLSRAMVLASGQAPYFCIRQDLGGQAGAHHRGTFRGGGRVIRYHGVPLDLATKVMGKLGAVLRIPGHN